MKAVYAEIKIPHWRQELRPKEAAAMLGVSTGLVYLLIREGKLRSRALVRNGLVRGIRLIRRSDVEALLALPKAEVASLEPDAPALAISGDDLPGADEKIPPSTYPKKKARTQRHAA